MTAHVRRPASTSSATEVNRVVNATSHDVEDLSPDTLTLLKLKVSEFDALEVSDNAAWVIAVAAVSTRWKRLFHLSAFDRIRFRHLAYGYQRNAHVALLAELTGIIP